MSVRTLVAAALALGLTACGGGNSERELRLLAPAGVVEDEQLRRFERETGCRVDVRVYDAEEDVDAIAERRDTDVIAGPTPNGSIPHVSEAMVRATLEGGIVVTIPRELASALNPVVVRPAGRRELSWLRRKEGDSAGCAVRWIAQAISQ
jgi:hypothetical protein